MKARQVVKFKKGASAAKDINVTPLIDVVLVLLIIFMVGSAIPTHEMSPNLPDKQVTVPEDQMPKDQLVAAIYEDNTVALNTVAMTLPELHDEVAKRLVGRSDQIVFVDAHPDANYAKVVELMDAVKDAGAETVAIASMKDEGPARPPGKPAAPPSPETPPATP